MASVIQDYQMMKLTHFKGKYKPRYRLYWNIGLRKWECYGSSINVARAFPGGPLRPMKEFLGFAETEEHSILASLLQDIFK
jgi:hypothetical protein